ncbi:translocon-associated protein subunit alpha-like [Oppia nitens]|uniref:translocon-associated protein subunit alpha-like n=1 Tax=Oppia nitens TaxID=1686743 RepID=UPI0023DC03E6|nr:translocon-associated protein subunit alpha-like [Oppia nitens]
MFQRFLLIVLLLVPISVILQQNGLSKSSYAMAAEDTKSEDTPDVVEGEEEANVEDSDILKSTEETDDEDSESVTLKPSPDINTFFLLTKPAQTTLELPAGKEVHFLVGFTNKGTKDFVVDSMDASFRYAQDFSFHLQNFSAIAYNRLVKPKQETTLAYQLFVSEAYSARPYGFTVNLYYRDSDGNQYLNAVFNETVNIVELDEGLDGETFFLYVFLAAVVVLVVVGTQQFFISFGKKHISSAKPKTEMGTSNPNDVDYDWLPQETLNSLNKSPKVRQSPRQRKVKRGTGSGDE